MGIFSRLFGRKKTAEEKVPEVREIPETEAAPEVHEMPEAEEQRKFVKYQRQRNTRKFMRCRRQETQPGIRGVPEAREAEGFEAMDRETVLTQTIQRLKEKTLKPVIHIDLNAEPAGWRTVSWAVFPICRRTVKFRQTKKGVSSGFWHSSGWQSAGKYDGTAGGGDSPVLDFG